MEQAILWGAGVHAGDLINKYKHVLPVNLFELVVDRNYEQRNSDWIGYKIQSPDKIDNAISNIIVIGSENYKTEIETILKEKYPDKQYVYIDDFLRQYTEKDLKNLAINHPWQWFGGEIYSQCGDDIIILNLFHNMGKDRFSYLDIGAHNPYIISNTALFYQKGCRGVNVDANPYLIEAFYKYRPDDLNLNVGIGIKKGNMPFYMVDKYSGLNSFSKEMVEENIKNWDNPNIKMNCLNVPVITLDDLVKEYCNGIFPDFLTIDIEGLDYSVLSSYDLKKDGPVVIDVEVKKGFDNSIRELLEGHGYRRIFRCGNNFIFVRSVLFNELLFGLEN